MKILTASPLPLSQGSWNRDITVLYRGFRALGHEAACIRLHSLDGADFPGVYQVGMKDMESPGWWREQRADLVVLNSWSHPRYTPILQAIKSSGSKAVIRLDSDGCVSPWSSHARYMRAAFYKFRSEGRTPPVAAAGALLKSFLYSLPSVYDNRMWGHMALADGIGIESEPAYEGLCRALRFYRREDLVNKTAVIHHPAVDEVCKRSGTGERSDTIVAVGRWDAFQKDAPLLVSSLRETLRWHTRWNAIVAGNGTEKLATLLQTLPASLRERIHILGGIPHEKVLDCFEKSKICLFSSRFEGCPISGVEALTLGCTIVGPDTVPSLVYLAGSQDGTVSRGRSVYSLSEALDQEIWLWHSSIRANLLPDRIERARERFCASQVCKRLLQRFGMY